MLAFGLELWTDAIWYQSVGYDASSGRRLGVRVGLFLGGLVLALVVLLGNLWLAGGSCRRPTGRRAADPRLPRAPERGAHGVRPGARGGRDPLGRRAGRALAALSRHAGRDAGPTPSAGWIIAIVAVLVALAVAGAIAANWETILLWMNRVPFDRPGRSP